MQQRLEIFFFFFVCADVIQKEEAEHCVHMSYIWNTCCSSHQNLLICGHGQINWRKSLKNKGLLCCRLIFGLNPLWIFVELFFFLCFPL